MGTKCVVAFLGKVRLWWEILRKVLAQSVRDVDAESVDATVGPEPQGFHEVCANLWIVPVEVWLFLGEQVQVPLAGRAIGIWDALPRRPAEDRLPVRRRQFAVCAQTVTEDVAVACGGASRGCQRFLEPLVTVRGMVAGTISTTTLRPRVLE